jgi:hypothetical protein
MVVNWLPLFSIVNSVPDCLSAHVQLEKQGHKTDMLAGELRHMVHSGTLGMRGNGQPWTPYEFSRSQTPHGTDEDELPDGVRYDGEQDDEEEVRPPDNVGADEPLEGEGFGAKEIRDARKFRRVALTSVIGGAEDYTESIGNMRYE